MYNGQRCAAHCLRQQGREIVDPDCNDPKMFNVSSNIIDRLMEMRQNDQQQAQLVMSDEAARPARLQVGYNDVKRKSKRRMFSRRNRQSRLKESTLERRRNEGTGDIADDENRNVHERFQVEVKAERLKGGKQRLNRHHSRNVQSTPLKSLLSSERRHPRIRQQSNRNLTKQRRKHCPKSRIRRRQS